jgi:hypothetical protein
MSGQAVALGLRLNSYDQIQAANADLDHMFHLLRWVGCHHHRSTHYCVDDPLEGGPRGAKAGMVGYSTHRDDLED